MKRCVLCFVGLLATIAFAILLETSAKEPSALTVVTEENRQMALRSEAEPEDEDPQVIRSEKSPENFP